MALTVLYVLCSLDGALSVTRTYANGAYSTKTILVSSRPAVGRVCNNLKDLKLL